MSAQQQADSLKIKVVDAGLIGKHRAQGILAESRTALCAVIDPSTADREYAEQRKRLP